ncbi:hypothetical protein PAPHI01_1571 [Pancytospora philotis]|nr:hypothetical protein PAPHI01_1571 [Pancytospora philotis]
MEDHHKIIKLGSIDITEYLNKTHATSDDFLVETQKHNMKKYKEELDDFLHISFVENCDALLAILDTYKDCRTLLQDAVAPKIVQQQHGLSANVPGCKAFEKACRHFHDDLRPFCTGQRYLLKATAFENYFCLLTNDLIFVGEEVAESPQQSSVEELRHGSDSTESEQAGSSTGNMRTRGGTAPKYVLRNTLDKTAVKFSKEDGCLLLDASTGASYELRGGQEDMDEFFEAFQGDVVEEAAPPRHKKPLDHALIEYYIETEQIDKLGAYAAETGCAGEILLPAHSSLRITSLEELKVVTGIFQDSSHIFIGFVVERFAAGLQTINKIQKVGDLIGDTFDYLDEFVGKLRAIQSEGGCQKPVFVLAVEQLVLCIFEFLDKRIFNKFYDVVINRENVKLIESRLVFQNLDFSYLLEQLAERRQRFADKCVEKAKREIDERLDALLL